MPTPPARPARTYWRDNLRLMGALLSVWFAASFGCGIVFRPLLDRFDVFGVPAGFWFAQQGAIYVFIALIVLYAVLAGRLERRHGVADAEADAP